MKIDPKYFLDDTRSRMKIMKALCKLEGQLKLDLDKQVKVYTADTYSQEFLQNLIPK